MTTKHDGRDLPYTLAEADANISEAMGRPAGFAETVQKLADIKAVSKTLKDRREQVWKQVKGLHPRPSGGGVHVVRSGAPGGGWVLRPVTSQRSATRKAYSAAVKAADAELWRRCLVPRRVITIAAPKDYTGSDLDVKLPALPNRGASAETLIRLYKSKLYTDQLRELGLMEDDAKLALDKLAAEIGWEGEQYRFTDGWRAQLVQETFDGDRLRQIDPAAWDRLSEVVETGGITKLTLMEYNKAVENGLVDLDEIDEIDGD
ncbi:hypothetical protein SEA_SERENDIPITOUS_64 [Mycobacterium phage Serendipitous]|uniref:Uncharacterized protein n=1 Tax=Mycobacterium phage Serendipitous TaxID=2301619 RepID=A0A385UHT1_9CAUD|nr:hypothetical protein I5G64_gp64 [Mycobacterium phage Serendipitous]AYB70605.1 hypothetical protein SEA_SERENDIPITOUS_64 [Mycobacterium phage Serendipitous]